MLIVSASVRWLEDLRLKIAQYTYIKQLLHVGRLFDAIPRRRVSLRLFASQCARETRSCSTSFASRGYYKSELVPSRSYRTGATFLYYAVLYLFVVLCRPAGITRTGRAGQVMADQNFNNSCYILLDLSLLPECCMVVLAGRGSIAHISQRH